MQLLQALLPLQKTEIAREMIKKLNKPETKIPSGKNANAERLLIGLYVSTGIFKENPTALIQEGDLLKKYIHQHIKNIPLSKASFILHHFKKFIGQTDQPVYTKKNKR